MAIRLARLIDLIWSCLADAEETGNEEWNSKRSIVDQPGEDDGIGTIPRRPFSSQSSCFVINHLSPQHRLSAT